MNPNVNKKMSAVLTEAVQRVFDALGPGHSESTYQNAVAHELRMSTGAIVSTEVVIPITYRGISVGFQRLDMVIESNTSCFPQRTLVEFKSVMNVTPAMQSQVRRYLDHMSPRQPIDAFLVNVGPHPDSKPEIVEIRSPGP